MFSWKFVLATAMTFISFARGEACTGIVHSAINGDMVYARTLEFGADFLSFNLLFVPRQIGQTAQSNPQGPKGAQWKNKYAYVGFNPFGMPVLADGINEKGLACGAFYFPGWAEYQQINEKSTPPISNLDVVGWILGNFSNINEAVDALKNTSVIGFNYSPWGIVPPLHYILVDPQGNSVVIEYVKGVLNIHDTMLGTITNSPTYDWHVTNIRNYIGLRALNQPSIQVDGQDLSSFGQGSGAIGLPGNFTPPARFIRAAFLNQVTLPSKDGLAGIERAFKILNQFDIPKGAVVDRRNGKDIYEETQWTSASDLANRRYYFHTAKNRNVRFVDLKSLDLDAKEAKAIPIDQPETFVDISSDLHK